MRWYCLKNYGPLLGDEIAWHHPRLRMVFEHADGWHYHRQVLAVIPNTRRGNPLCAGIASVLDRENQRYWPAADVDALLGGNLKRLLGLSSSTGAASPRIVGDDPARPCPNGGTSSLRETPGPGASCGIATGSNTALTVIVLTDIS